MVLSRNSRRFSVGILSALLITLGCAGTQQMYAGPPLPPEQVVTIKRDRGSLRVKIDGSVASGYEWQVLPGRRVIEADTRLFSDAYAFRATCSVRIEAIAGHEYVIEVHDSKSRDASGYLVYSSYAVVRDVATGDTFSCTN